MKICTPQKPYKVGLLHACPFCHSTYGLKEEAEECAIACEQQSRLTYEAKSCPTCSLYDPIINYISSDCPCGWRGGRERPPYITECENHMPVNHYELPQINH